MKKIIEIYTGAWKLSWAFLILIFTLIPVSSAFSEEELWAAVIEKNNESIFFADHNESLEEGGWVHLNGGKEIRLPQPLNFTYQGTACLESAGTTLKLKPGIEPGNYTELFLAYPYSTHPFYTTNENVEIDFKGPAAFGQQEVKIYLVEAAEGPKLSSLKEACTDLIDNNVLSFEEGFNNIANSSTMVVAATLNKSGDLSAPLNLGSLPAGSYGILIILDGNETKNPGAEKKVLSATCFEVLEHELEAEATDILTEGEYLEVNLALKNASENKSYTYGTLLIREEAYRAEINVSSNGTKAGTDIFINGINIIEEFGINSSNYESKLSKEELMTEIQTLIGEGNGTISVGKENQNTLSLTTADLPPGDYLLFAGAYEKGKGLTGIAQKELTIYQATTLQ
ncbi:MAG: TIGR04279 domain-containing protein [Methanosarcina sp.]